MTTQRTMRVGVLGAGQLALMLAEAAAPLGIELVCAGAPDECAHTVARIVETDLTDVAAVRAFAALVDVVTLESENIAASVLQGLALAPNAHAVAVAQDRLAEKNFLARCGIPVAPYAQVDSVRDLGSALVDLGAPAILKTRRMGYDGKGQFRLKHVADLDTAWDAVGGVPCVLEGFVAFEAEVSLLGVRDARGATLFYPLTLNTHSEGILRISRAPYDRPALQAEAEAHMQRVLTELDYVGVLAIEFFVKEGHLIANEMAPRVHNSGHWTIEGAATSQFENHLRAIVGMPLGETHSVPTVMLNCIGDMPTLADTAACAEIARHDYNKEPRPGRKVGHLTFPAKAVAVIDAWKQRLGVVE